MSCCGLIAWNICIGCLSRKRRRLTKWTTLARSDEETLASTLDSVVGSILVPFVARYKGLVGKWYFVARSLLWDAKLIPGSYEKLGALVTATKGKKDEQCCQSRTVCAPVSRAG